jgi:hypothetical protein
MRDKVTRKGLSRRVEKLLNVCGVHFLSKKTVLTSCSNMLRTIWHLSKTRCRSLAMWCGVHSKIDFSIFSKKRATMPARH